MTGDDRGVKVLLKCGIILLCNGLPAFRRAKFRDRHVGDEFIGHVDAA